MKKALLKELTKWHIVACMVTAATVSFFAVFFGGIPVLNSLVSFLYLFFIGIGTFFITDLVFINPKEKGDRLLWAILGYSITALAAHVLVYSIYLLLFAIEINFLGRQLLLTFIVTGFIGFFDIRFIKKNGQNKEEVADAKVPEIWKKGFPIKQRNRTKLVDYEDIVFIKAEDKYSSIVTDQKKFLSTKTITWLENNLPQEFVRVHRSYIINTQYFKKMEFVSGTKPVIILQEKEEVPVGNTYLRHVRSMFQS